MSITSISMKVDQTTSQPDGHIPSPLSGRCAYAVPVIRLVGNVNTDDRIRSSDPTSLRSRVIL
jgi:hypothetical protein